MRRRGRAGVHEGIDAVDYDLFAAEPQHRGAPPIQTAGLRRRGGERREGKDTSPMHREVLVGGVQSRREEEAR